jgi:uncharacterized membrane protein
MKFITFRKIQGIIGLTLGIIFGVSLAVGNWLVPLIAFAAGIFLELILRGRVKEVIADERTYTVSGKASRLTLQVGTICMALAGALLLAISHDVSYAAGQIAIVLCLSTCGLLVVNWLAYTYYNHKFGGRNE